MGIIPTVDAIVILIMIAIPYQGLKGNAIHPGRGRFASVGLFGFGRRFFSLLGIFSTHDRFVFGSLLQYDQ